MIHAYAKLYGFRAVALRYANVVGPRLRHGVIWDLINKLKKTPELEILGDGKQIRSYIYIDDAVETTRPAWRKVAEGAGRSRGGPLGPVAILEHRQGVQKREGDNRRAMKLTVAAIAYGRYKYLGEAIASIARQTGHPNQLVKIKNML